MVSISHTSREALPRVRRGSRLTGERDCSDDPGKDNLSRMAKKKQNGRTQSRHGVGRTPSKEEYEYHAKLHAQEKFSANFIQGCKTVGGLGTSASAVLVAYLAQPTGPAGAPWWSWVVMSVLATSTAFLAVLLRRETQRNGRLIERYAPFVKAHELESDVNRSSSNLLRDGETPKIGA